MLTRHIFAAGENKNPNQKLLFLHAGTSLDSVDIGHEETTIKIYKVQTLFSLTNVFRSLWLKTLHIEQEICSMSPSIYTPWTILRKDLWFWVLQLEHERLLKASSDTSPNTAKYIEITLPVCCLFLLYYKLADKKSQLMNRKEQLKNSRRINLAQLNRKSSGPWFNSRLAWRSWRSVPPPSSMRGPPWWIPWRSIWAGSWKSTARPGLQPDAKKRHEQRRNKNNINQHRTT